MRRLVLVKALMLTLPMKPSQQSEDAGPDELTCSVAKETGAVAPKLPPRPPVVTCREVGGEPGGSTCSPGNYPRPARHRSMPVLR